VQTKEKENEAGDSGKILCTSHDTRDVIADDAGAVSISRESESSDMLEEGSSLFHGLR
jgi:hypothetical protein